MKFTLSRSITIDAGLKKVLPFIQDFKQWSSWSPWSVIEPDHKTKVSGDPGKVGHEMYWNGKIIGEGKMTIEKAIDTDIAYDLQFLGPWKSSAKSRLKMKKVSEKKTSVTWSMEGNMPFYLFWMIGSMKSWIEMDYERGLSMLKEMVENGKIPAKTTHEGYEDFKGFSYVGIPRTSAVKDLPKVMSADYEKLMGFLKKQKRSAAHWLSIYTKINTKKQQFSFISACSDEDLQGLELPAEWVKGEIPSRKLLKIRHKGSYRFLGNAWSMGMMIIYSNNLKQDGDPFEYYHNSPHDTDEDKLITDIYFSVKGKN